jgi:hypothetical protein
VEGNVKTVPLVDTNSSCETKEGRLLKGSISDEIDRVLGKGDMQMVEKLRKRDIVAEIDRVLGFK